MTSLIKILNQQHWYSLYKTTNRDG